MIKQIKDTLVELKSLNSEALKSNLPLKYVMRRLRFPRKKSGSVLVRLELSRKHLYPVLGRSERTERLWTS